MKGHLFNIRLVNRTVGIKTRNIKQYKGDCLILDITTKRLDNYSVDSAKSEKWALLEALMPSGPLFQV